MRIDVRICGDVCLNVYLRKPVLTVRHAQLKLGDCRKRPQAVQGLPLGHGFRPQNGSRSQTNAAALAFDFIRLSCDHVWFASRQLQQEFLKAAAHPDTLAFFANFSTESFSPHLRSKESNNIPQPSAVDHITRLLPCHCTTSEILRRLVMGGRAMVHSSYKNRNLVL